MKKRLGVVEYCVRYVVDLGDKDMVSEAKDCVHEDVMNAVKLNEVWHGIDVRDDDTVKEEDIPDFLIPDYEEE